MPQGGSAIVPHAHLCTFDGYGVLQLPDHVQGLLLHALRRLHAGSRRTTTLLPSSSLPRPLPRPRAPLRSRAFIDQCRLTNRMSYLPRRPFVARQGRMALPIVAATCQYMGSLQEPFPRHAKSSAKTDAASTDSSGTGPEKALQHLVEARSCRHA